MTERAETTLYRKYRPETFAEVKEQDHIVSVLQGAIKKEAIPHALLFAGSRGTGKTTLARIFAREIGTTSMDLYEIDAASNRGIDDIRELREAVHTLPYESPYKVYIIDEVHMLTKDAFNALLKTLEEPPAHVVFILATTEEDKVLDTIRSRCQTFQFRAPTKAVLAEHLQSVAQNEQFTLKGDAAELIAIAADGSFRDALSILQKVILASGDAAGSADEVAEIIGAPKSTMLSDVLTGFADGDAQPVIAAVNRAHDAHVDMELFVRLLIERVRAVMLVRNGGDDASVYLSAFSDEEAEQLRTYASESAKTINSHLLRALLTAAAEMKRSPIPEASLELVAIEHAGKQH